jgi:hypothetical protein
VKDGATATIVAIVGGIALMWLCYGITKLEVSHASQYEIEQDLGPGARCTARRVGEWDCIYPVTRWTCEQAGGFDVRCKPSH